MIQLNYKMAILLFMCILYIALAAVIYIKGQNRQLSLSFTGFAGALTLWSFGLAMFFSPFSYGYLDFWARFLYFSGSLVAATFLLFSFVYPETPKYKFCSLRTSLIFLPAIITALLLFFSEQIIVGVFESAGGVRGFIYGNYRFLWELQFNASLLVAFIRFLNFYRTSTGVLKIHLFYITLANFTICIGSGLTNVYLLWFDKFDYVWLGPPLTLVWFSIVCFTIIKYHLMDIKVVITRASIFLFVYTVVLGIPFFIGYQHPNNWVLPVSVMALLATVGPYAYMYLQRKAENQILQEQKKYQNTLRKASVGMGQIKDLRKLLKLIVHVVHRTVKISFCEIFILHDESNNYVLKASRGRKTKSNITSIKGNNEIIKQIIITKDSFVSEEYFLNATDTVLEKVNKEFLMKLDAELIIPSFIENKLIAIIILGEKSSGKPYTEDDISVFSILANQAGLAIENAQFYEKTKKTTEQLFKAEKMATIGTMADGLSHQINNRLHSMGFVAGDALDTLKLFQQKKQLDDETRVLVDDMKYALERIQDNVKRGGEVVGGLLRYSRKGAEGITAVDLNELINTSVEMAQFKVKFNQFKFVRHFNGNLPKIKGNFTQLQEVFFNVIDNAYDAMMQRKADLKEENFEARLEIFAHPDGKNLNIIVKDTGIGIKPEDHGKIFTPFFTTKATSKKGTGLGMYVIKQIIEENHGGKVRFESRYKQGTQITITLPQYV